MASPPSPPPPAEQQAVRDLEKQERQVTTLEVTEVSQDKTTTDEIKDKLKIPTISVGLIIFAILNLIEFFVGVTTTKECSLETMIPIYLAIKGAGGLLIKMMPIINRNKRIELIDKIVCALLVLELVWMICGSYWIYHIYPPNYISQEGLYCNKTAYLLAFWLLTLNYIAILLLITIPCCILCCFCCLACIAAE